MGADMSSYPLRYANEPLDRCPTDQQNDEQNMIANDYYYLMSWCVHFTVPSLIIIAYIISFNPFHCFRITIFSFQLHFHVSFFVVVVRSFVHRLHDYRLAVCVCECDVLLVNINMMTMMFDPRSSSWGVAIGWKKNYNKYSRYTFHRFLFITITRRI